MGAASPAPPDTSRLLHPLLADPMRPGRVTHVERLPPRPAVVASWPTWLPEPLVAAWRARGIHRPWSHQVEAAQIAWSGRHVVLATGTASGKSLGYLMPSLTAALRREGGTIYLASTKALAADQLRSVTGLGLPLAVATVDGDSADAQREWARRHAEVIFTNPDMLHRGLLPSHRRWSRLWRSLRYVVVDECHGYRGMFGGHVAMVLRRLRRVAAAYGADPVFVLASATLADPERSAARLTGVPVTAVTRDGSPRPGLDLAFWDPARREVAPDLPDPGDEASAGALAAAADLLADLVRTGARTVAFVRSRRGAETVALLTRRRLRRAAPGRAHRVAAYRSGYLAEDRRRLEQALHSGELLGLASTNALELGVDICGLDAVLITGWPGTRVSLWQQAGRAGRGDAPGVAVFIARDDPLDRYLVEHPEAVVGAPVEATVIDPDNPYLLAPHLLAAAAEAPVTEADLTIFGPAAGGVLDTLAAAGRLRRRSSGWFWTGRDRPCDRFDLRGGAGEPVRICELGTGRLLGTVDAVAADRTVHPEAVYLHQGETFLVANLDREAGVALVRPGRFDFYTTPRTHTDLTVVDRTGSEEWAAGGAAVHLGTVDVSTQVVGFLRRRVGSGEVLGEVALDLPRRDLRTVAVWWTVGPGVLAQAGVAEAELPGALHAAEHAAIGLLPLLATCDRWDLGGLSTPLHPDTGTATIFVYDGHPGGAGFAARGYDHARRWLAATREAIGSCACQAGCPGCVHSPKCGNGNEPLDKAAAWRLLGELLG